MNAAVNRRAFVASVATGFPCLAGAAAYGFATPTRPHEHTTIGAAGGDAVFDHVLRELAVVLNRARGRGFAGEDARAIAAQVRTAMVRGTQIGVDAMTRKGVQQLVRSRGRDAVLAIEIDTARMAAQLKRYDIAVDPRWFGAAMPDDATRRRGLDALTSGGVTGVLSHAAVVFERLGSTLDRSSGSIMRVRHVQSDPLYYSSLCWEVISQIVMLAGQAGPICEAAAIVQELESLCTTILGILAAYYSLYWAYCI